MKDKIQELLSGEILDDSDEITLAELCQTCRLSAEQVLELVEYGIVEPRGQQPSRWRFHHISIRRIQCAQRLKRDLGVNTAGIALALDLLDELEQLRNKVQRLKVR